MWLFYSLTGTRKQYGSLLPFTIQVVGLLTRISENKDGGGWNPIMPLTAGMLIFAR